MTNNKIVIIDTGYESFAYEKELLEKAGYTLSIFPGNRDDEPGKINFARDAVGLFVRWTPVDKHFLSKTPYLKAIVRYGTGYDNIDLTAVTQHGVKAANVQGYANHSVSDHTMAMMYACLRDLPAGEVMLHAKYAQPPRKNIFELHDKTLGIIGLGRIGGTFCQKARPLFQRTLAVDPYISMERFQSLGAIPTDLDNLLAESHIISIHCNLTDETRHLINADAFNKMTQKPILINTSRGCVIHEEALKKALSKDKLHALGLDVYCDEPPQANVEEIIMHPKVITTGHYAWYSTNAMVELQRRAAYNMLNFLTGEHVADCLNCEFI